jgi:hypothetical protein
MQHPKKRHYLSSTFFLIACPLRPVLHLGGQLQSRQPSITCCIQESDGLHQIFSGNQTRMGVTYLQFQLATWRLQPRADQSGSQFCSRSSLAHFGSQVFMAAVLPEGCS